MNSCYVKTELVNLFHNHTLPKKNSVPYSYLARQLISRQFIKRDRILRLKLQDKGFMTRQSSVYFRSFAKCELWIVQRRQCGHGKKSCRPVPHFPRAVTFPPPAYCHSVVQPFCWNIGSDSRMIHLANCKHVGLVYICQTELERSLRVNIKEEVSAFSISTLLRLLSVA